MNRATGTWLAILILALAFRVPKLADRPMHADEAVLADKLGGLIETGSYPYDPQEHHGPALAWLASASARLVGAHSYLDLTEATIRLGPVMCGVVLALMPLLLVDGLGRWQAAAGGALTAISPAMVYYSRYYIPEMLLTVLTSAAIVFGYRYACSRNAGWAIAAGVAAGLMLTTKETGAVALGCMAIALAATTRRKPAEWWPLAVAAGVAALIPAATVGFWNGWNAALIYSQRAFHPHAHGHSWNYYLRLLLWRQDGSGPIWSEAPILVLALVGLAWSASRSKRVPPLVRYLAIYGCAMTAAYSAIPYKTPWCVLGPLHAMILLAGTGAVALLRSLPRYPQVAVACLLGLCAAQLARQAWRASFPFSADPRNPYAYSPTSRDVYAVRDSIERLARSHPEGRGITIQVISGENPWPLPWYLRGFSNVQWRRGFGPGFQAADTIIYTPEMEGALVRELYEVPPPGSRNLYRPLLDRYVELRPGLELRAYVRASLPDLTGCFVKRRRLVSIANPAPNSFWETWPIGANLAYPGAR